MVDEIIKEINRRVEMAKKIIVEPAQDELDRVANETAEAFISAYQACIKIIEDYEQRNLLGHKNKLEMIPVCKRLPKFGEEILVQWKFVDKYMHETYTFRTLATYTEEGFLTMQGLINGKIVAWCPLPKIYEEE